jgi:small conductance mechanosensitive channel
MDEQLDTLEHAQQTAIDLAIQFGPRLQVALLILAAGVPRREVRLLGTT